MIAPEGSRIKSGAENAGGGQNPPPKSTPGRKNRGRRIDPPRARIPPHGILGCETVGMTHHTAQAIERDVDDDHDDADVQARIGVDDPIPAGWRAVAEPAADGS